MTMISYSCTRGFMPNSHKKSLMVCSVSVLFRLQLEEPITNAVWHGLGSAQCPCSLLPVRKKAPLVDKFYFCGGNQPYGSVGYNGFEVLVDFKYPYILTTKTNQRLLKLLWMVYSEGKLQSCLKLKIFLTPFNKDNSIDL